MSLQQSNGALLIFDEVMTGFRVGYNCAQGYFGITPDITCLGKVIGGGLPVGAYGGKAEIMEKIAPSGSDLSSRYLIRKSTCDDGWI